MTPEFMDQHCRNLASDADAAAREGIERARKEQADQRLLADLFPNGATFHVNGKHMPQLSLPPGKATDAAGERRLMPCFICGALGDPAGPPPPSAAAIYFCADCTEDQGEEGRKLIARAINLGIHHAAHQSAERIAALERYLAEGNKIIVHLLARHDAACADEAALRREAKDLRTQLAERQQAVEYWFASSEQWCAASKGWSLIALRFGRQRNLLAVSSIVLGAMYLLALIFG